MLKTGVVWHLFVYGAKVQILPVSWENSRAFKIVSNPVFSVIFFVMSWFLLGCLVVFNTYGGDYLLTEIAQWDTGWPAKYSSSSQAQIFLKALIGDGQLGGKCIYKKYFFVFTINAVTNMLQFTYSVCICVHIYLQILTIKDPILICKKIIACLDTVVNFTFITTNYMYTYTSLNEPEEGLAKLGPGAIFTTPIFYMLFTGLVLVKLPRLRAHSPRLLSLWRHQQGWEITKTTLRFSNSLEGFIELAESYHTYNYDLLQGNDTH